MKTVFSERENDIIKVIGKKKMTLEQISKEVFKDDANYPFDAVISVGNTIRRIIKKCEYHSLEWTLVKNKVNGRLVIKKGDVVC